MPSRRVVGADERPSQTVIELVDEITLGGMRVQVRGQELDLSVVKLDPANPRVANTVLVSAFGEGRALQLSLTKLLWDDPDVHALYQSVLQNKGLVERIIVRHDGTVAEGNCRTVVYRKLRRTSRTIRPGGEFRRACFRLT